MRTLTCATAPGCDSIPTQFFVMFADELAPCVHASHIFFELQHWLSTTSVEICHCLPNWRNEGMVKWLPTAISLMSALSKCLKMWSLNCSALISTDSCWFINLPFTRGTPQHTSLPAWCTDLHLLLTKVTPLLPAYVTCQRPLAEYGKNAF